MSYRSLWVSDIHVNNALPYARRQIPSSPITDRLMDTIGVLDRVTKYAIAHKLTDVWIPGDLLDRRLVDAVTLDTLVKQLAHMASMGLLIRLIPGNHEAFDQSASAYTLNAFGGLWNNAIEVWDRDFSLEVGDWRFRCVPYKPDAEAREYIKRIAEEEAHSQVCLVLHQSIVGGLMGGYKADHGVPLDELRSFAHVISGHFHTPQHVGANVQYLGAPLHHTFGDAGEQRGFWDMTFGADVKATLIGGGAPNFHNMEWDWEAGRPNNTGPLLIQPLDYIQLNVTGTAAQIKEARPQLDAAKDQLMELGVRQVKVTPVTVASAKTRAKVAEERTGKVTWPKAIVGYLDACDLAGLDRTQLIGIAREAMEEAEA